MKKTVPVFLTCLLLCAALLSSCSQTPPDPKAIVGAWEYRSQVWCDFKEDGTCAIGGTTGTYSVSDDMVLTMTPNGGDAQTFEWAGAKEKVTTSNWADCGRHALPQRRRIPALYGRRYAGAKRGVFLRGGNSLCQLIWQLLPINTLLLARERWAFPSFFAFFW